MTIRIDRVYTRRGDSGLTTLAQGERLSKGSTRISAIGEIDELNAWIGSIRGELPTSEAEVYQILVWIQNGLFNAGADLATGALGSAARIQQSITSELEKFCDAFNADLPPLDSFVLPGGCRISSQFHIARAVSRRAERALIRAYEEYGETSINPELIPFLNRLGDLLFILARHADLVSGAPELLWDPTRS